MLTIIYPNASKYIELRMQLRKNIALSTLCHVQYMQFYATRYDFVSSSILLVVSIILKMSFTFFHVVPY